MIEKKREHGFMTLDEAIEHCNEKAIELLKKDPDCPYGQEHLQLAGWLVELKTLRKENQDLKRDLGTFL